VFCGVGWFGPKKFRAEKGKGGVGVGVNSHEKNGASGKRDGGRFKYLKWNRGENTAKRSHSPGDRG